MMLDVEYDCLIRFVREVLNSENGATEKAFLRLQTLADSMHACRDHAERSHVIEGILDRTQQRSDGRFYLPEGR